MWETVCACMCVCLVCGTHMSVCDGTVSGGVYLVLKGSFFVSKMEDKSTFVFWRKRRKGSKRLGVGGRGSRVLPKVQRDPEWGRGVGEKGRHCSVTEQGAGGHRGPRRLFVALPTSASTQTFFSFVRRALSRRT